LPQLMADFPPGQMKLCQHPHGLEAVR
jgi:hypothetical protein